MEMAQADRGKADSPESNIRKVRLKRFRSPIKIPLHTRAWIGHRPELPTMIESGVPDYQVSTFIGVMAPAATPPAFGAFLTQEYDKWSEVVRSAGIKIE
jgi:hypothetical protein